MDIDTPAGTINQITPIREFVELTTITNAQYLLGIQNMPTGNGSKITFGNLITSLISGNADNKLVKGSDDKLFISTPIEIGTLANLTTSDKTNLVSAINEVDGDISTETANRVNADNNLQSQIDAITAASDVTDIVGTYAQLQAYDTTGLPDNSIIKVLQDESRQDETTYYRWVITGGVGAWVLIGEEGPYYTKSQADSLFATQQTTGNLASLDTSDKTSLVNAINELSSVLDPTQTADYINNSKAVESGSVSSNSIVYADIKKYAHSSFDLSKFTVVGNPNITSDGIASGFSINNYLMKSSIPEAVPTQNWCVKMTIRTPFSQPATYRMICALGNNNDTYFRNTAENSKYLGVEFHNVGPSVTLQESFKEDGAFTFGTWYNIEFGQKLINNKYISFFRYKHLNANTFNELINNTATSFSPINELLRIGYWNNSGQAGAEDYIIDLKQFQIEVDGIPVFSGNKTGIDTIKPDNYTVVGTPTISADGIASGFSTSNYITNNDIITFANKIVTYRINNLKIIDHTTTSNVFTVYGTHTSTSRFYIATRIKNNKDADFFYGGANLSDTFTQPISSSLFNCEENFDMELIINGTNVRLNIYQNNSLTGYSELTLTVTPIQGNLVIGTQKYNDSTNYGQLAGSIDLNAFKIYVDGNLVYQPCLKIPYTAGSNQYGGKYVDVAYRDRVQDAYEQGLANDYFTIDEENQNFTLPMGEVYGMIGDKVSKKGDTMTGTLALNRQHSESGGPQYLRFNHTEYDFNNPFEGHLNEYLTFFDKNGIDLATIQHRFGTDYNDLFFRVRPLGDTETPISGLPGLAMRTLANGDTFAYAPASDVISSILTTAGIKKAANGYVKLGNGIIIQWGANLTASSQNPTITFPTAFSSSNYFAMAYGREAANWDHTWGFKNSATATSCKFYVANGDKFQWIAIGY